MNQQSNDADKKNPSYLERFLKFVIFPYLSLITINFAKASLILDKMKYQKNKLNLEAQFQEELMKKAFNLNLALESNKKTNLTRLHKIITKSIILMIATSLFNALHQKAPTLNNRNNSFYQNRNHSHFYNKNKICRIK